MDDTPDPSAQFFPGVPLEEIDLYATLIVPRTATLTEIKQSYRKLALVHHPDKHVNSTSAAQTDASLKFQQIGFSYSVLNDEKKRERYDKTGRTDEGSGLDPGEGGWEAYFEDLFDKVTKGKLDEMKKEYQGSEEEVNDLREAYIKTEGSIDDILAEIPHSNHEDELRFISVLKPLIKKGDLPEYPAWKTSISDLKAREQRKKRGEKEAKEAEAHAKELGVWDEFYGSGTAGPRKAKGKGKTTEREGGDDVDESALQALILKRQQKRGAALDSLLAKYGGEDGGEDGTRNKRSGAKRKGKQVDEADAEETEEIEAPARKAAKSTSKSDGRKKRRKVA